MKIAITGHTSGVGQGIYEFYKKHKHEVLGFSRTNGYDINRDSHKIVEDAKDSDIFINNAYYDFSQIDILFKLWEQWHDKEKIVININSVIHLISYPYTYHPYFSRYKVHKLSLDRAVRELQQTPSKCQVSQITPGYIETESLIEAFKSKKKLSVKDIVEMVDFIITSKSNFKVHNIVVGEVY